MDLEPAGQGEQLSPLLNVFLGQVEQLLPFDAGILPPGHWVQEPEPALLILPDAQSVQDFAPALAYEPAGQTVQLPEESTDPAGQVRAQWPGEDRCVKRESG